MRKLFLALTLLALAPTAAPAAITRPPVVVELYTAQGCSACRTATDHVAELSDDPGVLTLTFGVDYWDYLGWPDSFAQPVFAERQRAYAKTMALREVYTPQVVIDGRYQTVGSRIDQVDALVDQAGKAPRDPPDMMFLGRTKVAVGSGPLPRGGAEVWLIRYDPREIEITPKRGDNRGETLTHKNVVRQAVRLGGWWGRPTAFRLPPLKPDGLKTVILLQAKGGRILGVLQEKS